jgi:hypothetical protein
MPAMPPFSRFDAGYYLRHWFAAIIYAIIFGCRHFHFAACDIVADCRHFSLITGAILFSHADFRRLLILRLLLRRCHSPLAMPLFIFAAAMMPYMPRLRRYFDLTPCRHFATPIFIIFDFDTRQLMPLRCHAAIRRHAYYYLRCRRFSFAADISRYCHYVH